MSTQNSAVALPFANRLRFVATDVTGLRRREFEAIDGQRTAGDVALDVVSAMDLPTDVPWSLRDQKHQRMLRQDETLGSQITTDAELAVIPKSHLGGIQLRWGGKKRETTNRSGR